MRSTAKDLKERKVRSLREEYRTTGRRIWRRKETVPVLLRLPERPTELHRILLPHTQECYDVFRTLKLDRLSAWQSRWFSMMSINEELFLQLPSPARELIYKRCHTPARIDAEYLGRDPETDKPRYIDVRIEEAVRYDLRRETGQYVLPPATYTGADISEDAEGCRRKAEIKREMMGLGEHRMYESCSCMHCRAGAQFRNKRALTPKEELKLLE